MYNIVGSILIGGKSKRMGGGLKCLKSFNNKTILERVFLRSKKQISSLIINSNITTNELLSYSLPIVKDSIPGYLGPLAGIHASLDWSIKFMPKTEWIVTFAGDSPFFPINLVKNLYNEATKKNKKIVIANNNNRNHPVFGIWHISLINDLEETLKKQNLRKIIHWASKHEFETFDFKYQKYDPFFNINTQEDIYKAEEIENYFLA